MAVSLRFVLIAVVGLLLAAGPALALGVVDPPRLAEEIGRRVQPHDRRPPAGEETAKAAGPGAQVEDPPAGPAQAARGQTIVERVREAGAMPPVIHRRLAEIDQTALRRFAAS